MRGGERAREREGDRRRKIVRERGHTLCCNMAKNGLGERERERLREGER